MALPGMFARKSRTHSPAAAPPAPRDPHERLQKVLAAAGMGSRRRCEELIVAGRVEVDGRVVTQLGSKADPARQSIRVDGVPLASPRRVYFMVHKPLGVVSTNRDPAGRPRVIDLVPYPERLFAVGRLDLSSEGLILVTNDGELSNRLTHPRYGVEKTYQVEVAGTIERHELEKLRKGVHLAEGFARVVSARVKRQYKHSTQLEITLAEGRNREIRRILARAGHKVLRLKRVAFGPLRLAELPPGAVRELDRDEVRKLKSAARSSARGRARRPMRATATTATSATSTKPAASAARTIIGGADAPIRAADRRRNQSRKKPRRRRPAAAPRG